MDQRMAVIDTRPIEAVDEDDRVCALDAGLLVDSETLCLPSFRTVQVS